MENKMMKTVLKVTALACMLMTASAGAAIEDNTLQIQGTVTPASCVPALSNGGEVDFGNTITEKLTQENNQLPSKELAFTITCQHAAKISLHMIDNYPAGRRPMVITNAYDDNSNSTAANQQFGLGLDSEGKPVGAYSVGITGNPQDRGNGVYIIGSSGGGWAFSDTWAFTNGTGETTYLSFTGSDSVIEPAPISKITMMLKISAAVASNTAVDMKDAINFNGSSTIVMTYL
ncbi:DUF1120 domain-containing protein [Enterobacter sp.]|uniref:DUF1120 domain-containing protein n=1 Tax=Enterobacter sp. TaxID=42895 RepID=UPI00296F6C4A|nr:DUF1120 domain-containing protein [Enterobacter sp.]